MRRALPLIVGAVALGWLWQRGRAPALEKRTADRLRPREPRTPSAADIHVG